MARVTVEDCIVKVPNRFKLVLLASRRARDLSAGVAETVERENDKNPVVALREIAGETISLDELNESLVSGLQKYVEVDEPEDDSMAILAAAEKEWAGVTTDSPKATNSVAVVDAKGEAVVEAAGEADAETTGEANAAGEADAETTGEANAAGEAETAGEGDGSTETAPDAAPVAAEVSVKDASD